MKYRILVLFFISIRVAYSQVSPDWVNPILRKSNYPNSKFYVGFVSMSYNKGQDITMYPGRLSSAARVALAESIFISIKSEANLTLSNNNGVADDRYNKTTVTTSSLEAVGLITETFFDQKNRIGYGFAYVGRNVLVTHYHNLVSDGLKAVASEVDLFEDHENDINFYVQLSEQLSQLEKISEYQDMLKYLEVNNENILMKNKWHELYSSLHDALYNSMHDDQLGLNEAAYFLVENIKSDLELNDKELALSTITYKNTGVVTQFSSYFNHLISRELERNFGSVLRQVNGNELVVSGNYWPTQDKIKLVIDVNNMHDGEILKYEAGSSLSVDKSIIDELDLSYDLPDEQNTLKKNSLLQPVESKGGLMAQFSTQKGTQSVVFKEGELLELYVTVSRPAYVRILNIWSDDQKFLLSDNYYIGPDQVNQNVKLSMSWETACPCGVEYLQLIASDQALPPLPTTNENEFLKIDGELSEALSLTRGFKQSGSQYAESTIIVTTLPKP